MSTQTPGPWTALANEWDEVLPEKDRDHDWYVVAANEEVITLRLSEPNARLIAAAPDLLKLVKDIANLDHYCLAHGDKTLINDLRAWKLEARAAIAKAEGTS